MKRSGGGRSALILERVSKAFDGRPAVADVALAVRNGDLATLLGPSGCGKTTLLRMIAGLERPDEGRIELDGTCLYSDRPRSFVPPNRRGIGMVFQDYALWPHMTVGRTVSYPLRTTRASVAQVRGTVSSVLAQVRLDGMEKRFPHQLSGGEQQRVALARALVTRPRLLLLDEPLSNLDAQLRKEMRVELKRVKSETGVTVLHVTHDQSEALALADWLIVMSHGRVEQCGRPEELYESPRTSFVARFVGDANLLSAAVVRRGDRTELRLPGGEILPSAVPSESEGDGAERQFAVHPHDVLVSREGGTSAVILERGYMGESWHYVVQIGDTRLRVQTPVREVYGVGEVVHLKLRHVSCVRASRPVPPSVRTPRGPASGARGARRRWRRRGRRCSR